MSIALQNEVRELAARLEAAEQRIAALEARKRPGPRPKPLVTVPDSTAGAPETGHSTVTAESP